MTVHTRETKLFCLLFSFLFLFAAKTQIAYAQVYTFADQSCTTSKAGSTTVSGSVWKAQTFVPSVSGQLKRVQLAGSGFSPTILHIQTTQNGYPTSFDLASTSASCGNVFDFGEGVFLEKDLVYALVLSNSNGYFSWDYSNSISSCYTNPLGSPFTSTNGGNLWGIDQVDFHFTTYMQTSSAGITPVVPPSVCVPTGTPSITPSRTPSPTRTPTPTYNPFISPTPTIYSTPTPTGTLEYAFPRVFVLVYDPKVPSLSNGSLINYYNWNKPYDQADQYVREIEEASHGLVRFQIVGRKTVDDMPVKQNGFDYTGQSLFDCLEREGPCNEPPSNDFANYTAILQDHDICWMVNRGEIDEVWMSGPPRTGFFEAVMAGVGGFWTNGPVVPNTTCQRPIHIMGFNYERGMDSMLHDMGHRAEAVFDRYVGYTRNSYGISWGDFRSNKHNYAGQSVFGCGDTHNPPNASSDYDYANTQTVTSRCNDLTTYPSLTGKTDDVNCQTWGCPEASEYNYMRWLFSHFPHTAGFDSLGHKNNWWYYMTTVQPQSIPTLSPYPTFTPIPPSPTSTLSPTVTSTATHTPTPAISPTPVLSVSTKNAVVTIVKDSNPNSYSYTTAFSITNTGSFSTGMQMVNNNDGLYTPFGGTPAPAVSRSFFGFQTASANMSPNQSIAIQAYIDNRKPAGLYSGSYNLFENRAGSNLFVATISYSITVLESPSITPSVTTTTTPTLTPTPTTHNISPATIITPTPTSIPTSSPTPTGHISALNLYYFYDMHTPSNTDKNLNITFSKQGTVHDSRFVVASYDNSRSVPGFVQITNPPIGVFDVTIRTDRHLAKTVTNVILYPGYNALTINQGLLAGDIDNVSGSGFGDNTINLLDFNQLISNWGKSATRADINFDGIVDINDFNYLVAMFGTKGD